MGNLVVAIIGIVFCAALMVAGISYIKPTAYVEHNQATVNTAQIESLVSDYNNLTVSVGHRPSVADYSAVYSSKSNNSQYAYSAVNGSSSGASSTLTTNSKLGTSGIGSWQFMPGCANGTQDCFCLKVSDGSPVTFKAIQYSALHQMTSGTQSRVELSASQCDDSSAVVNPTSSAWAAPAAASGTGISAPYYITVRLTAGTSAATTTPTTYTYVAKYTPYCAPGCSDNEAQTITSYSCIQYPGGATVSNTFCPTPVAPTCVNHQTCPTVPNWTPGGTSTCNTTTGQSTNNWLCYLGPLSEPQSVCLAAGGSSAPTQAQITGTCGTTNSSQYTYTYVNQQYGSCTAACGNSSAALTSWQCKRSDGTLMSDNSFCTSTGNVPPATQSCTSYAGCIATAPVYSSTCSTTCGTGTAALQSYSCTDGQGNTTDSSHCSGSSLPQTQSCTSTTGCTYTANASTYLTCTPACGSSTASASAWTCQQSDGQTVSQSVCLAHGVSPTAQSCTNYSLCAPENVTYSSTCSNTCGTGTESLNSGWTCGYGTQTTTQSHCTAPASTQACTSTTGCTYTASNPTVYGSCSTTCGTGTQTASVFTCTRSDGTVVAQSYCTAPTKACTSTSSCIVHDTYGACSTTCGTGTQSLNSGWTCTDSAGHAAPSTSYCTAPAATQSCTATSTCTYIPVLTSIVWGACSTTCGTGTQTATTYLCLRSDGTVQAQGNCPAPTQACTSTSNCVAHATYGTCSTTCGAGTEPLNSGWTCTDSAGHAAPSTSYCTAPASTTACTNYGGCTYTASNPTVYGSCSTTCGNGSQTATTFVCTRSDGVVVAQSYCTAPTKSCSSTSNCVVHDSYGTCSTTCGTGTQTLNSGWTCTDSAGHAAPSTSYCTAPASSQACTATSGCGYIASNPTAYGACSSTCGTGTQTATAFTCTRSDGTVEPLADCTAPTKSCSSTSGCVVHDTYGACSTTCGTGTQTLNSGWTCTDGNGTQAPSTSYCTAPANTQACSVYTSCTYTASNPTAYGGCSTTCGTGTQSATSYTCTRSDGTVVTPPSNYCTAPTQSCTDYSTCAFTYAAINVVYSATCAPATCGGNSHYPVTSWQCQRSPDGSIVDQSYCTNSGNTPPVRSCIDNSDSSCYTYSAVNPQYGTCMTVCGSHPKTGTQSLPTSQSSGGTTYYSGFECLRSNGSDVDDSDPGCQALISNGTLPATQSCTTAAVGSNPACPTQ